MTDAPEQISGAVASDTPSADGVEVEPTYAPAAMALGVMMLLWGVVTMWVMSAAGAGLIVWSLCQWIGEIRRSHLDIDADGPDSAID